MRITTFLAGLLLWVQLSPPLGSQAPESQPQPTGTLGGVVTDAVSGEPLSKVTLTLGREGRGARPISAKTDLEGKFLFENLELGRYRLRAERNRYVASEYGQRAPNQQGTPLTLQAGQKLTGLTMQLQRAAVISGRVLDEDNEPVAGARVAAMTPRYMQGGQRFFPVEADETDDRGEYRIFGLAPGEYYVSTSQNNRGRAIRLDPPSTVQEEEETYVETYFPGTTEMEQAVALKVAASQELLGVDIQLRPTRTFRVTGRVVNEAGEPLSARNVMLTLFPRNMRSANFGSLNRTSARNPEGDFTLQGVTPGSYTLLAEASDRRDRFGGNAPGGMLSGRLDVDVAGRNVERLVVPVRPGIRLEGRLQAEGSAGIDLSNVMISLRSQEPMLAVGGGGGTGRVNEDGRFTLAVTQGVYEVMLGGAPEGAYLKAARLGNQEVLTAGLDLTNAAVVSDMLELTLGPKGGRVDGAVVNAEGQPAVGAQVVLLPEASRRQRVGLFKSTTTDQNGVFTLRGIAPGNYSIVALENVERGAWMDPNFLRGNENAATKVEIQEGSAQSFELKVLSLGASR